MTLDNGSSSFLYTQSTQPAQLLRIPHVLFLLKLSVSPTPLLVSQKQELDVIDYCTFHKTLAHGLMQEATCRGRNTVALGVRQCWV